MDLQDAQRKEFDVHCTMEKLDQDMKLYEDRLKALAGNKYQTINTGIVSINMQRHHLLMMNTPSLQDLLEQMYSKHGALLDAMEE